MSTQPNDANGGTPSPERLGSQFDEWLTDQPMWVKCLTNSYIVKDAMKLAFYANMKLSGPRPLAAEGSDSNDVLGTEG